MWGRDTSTPVPVVREWDGMVVASTPSFRVGCPFLFWLGMSVSPAVLSPVVPPSGTVAASTQAALVSRADVGAPC